MRRPFLFVLGGSVLLVLLVSAWPALRGSSKQFEPITVVRLPCGRELPAKQRQAQLRLLKISTNLVDLPLATDVWFSVSNRSRISIEMMSYEQVIPFYRIEVKKGKNWGLIPTGVTTEDGIINLRSGAVFEFNALVPTGCVMRIGVAYQGTPPAAPPLYQWIRRMFRLYDPQQLEPLQG